MDEAAEHRAEAGTERDDERRPEADEDQQHAEDEADSEAHEWRDRAGRGYDLWHERRPAGRCRIGARRVERVRTHGRVGKGVSGSHSGFG